MVRSWEMDECWGGKLDLVWIFHGIYRRFGVIPQVFLSSLLFFLFGDFQSLFLVIFFRWTLCGFCEGCTHNPLVVIFLVPPSQIRGNMCSIWGFLEISWRGLLGVHLLIPLDLVSLGAQIIAMRCPWGTHTIHKVSCKSVEWVGRSGRIFGGVNLWIVVHPERPGCDQSERCSTPVWTVLLFVGFWPGWTFRGVGLSLGLQLFWVCAGLAFGVSGSCTWVFFCYDRSDRCVIPVWSV
jgi:hypothetical protein